jgi:hypothetical protein
MYDSGCTFVAALVELKNARNDKKVIMAKTFVLSEESVNSYGFKVLTQGIDLTNFKKNPIMLWNHTRSYSDKNNVILPIGKWENIRVEEGALKADAVFDMEDEFAASISRKVDKGMINMCSIGFEVTEESDSPEHISIGQRRKTVVKCKLREASITDIGSNYNAISLYSKEGKVIELTEGGECPIGLLKDSLIKNNNNEKFDNMKMIALKLGLPDTANEAQMIAEIEKLLKVREELTAKDNTIKTLQENAKRAEKKAIQDMVNAAVSCKKLTADKSEHFVSLGETIGIEKLKATLDAITPAVKPSSFIGASSGSDGKQKKYSELSSDELIHLRNNDTKVYIALYKEEFGFEPVLD